MLKTAAATATTTTTTTTTTTNDSLTSLESESKQADTEWGHKKGMSYY